MEHTISFAERNAGLQVGVSNASITANFYSQQPERPETPPCPLSTVPFRRDPYFVEHGTLFDLIREKWLAPASRIALVGLGNVRAAALGMVEERDIITVHPMDGNHAQTLFEAKLGIPENSKDIMKLTAALEYMPLAIVQAASYIRQRAPRSSVKQYLQQFESSDSRKLSLLEHEDVHYGETGRPEILLFALGKYHSITSFRNGHQPQIS
ncbi:hypothetical protein CNMCM6936_009710 [Aspergillus lentulus]|uniref:Uncharacterized protein n=1 Tax=Aspergillus lentulus TaxID=293939 RepID=A0AAN5YX84_ASPLE|nr:hypothetical protein CNMCM6069_006029 [Aspergillus lentulus]KAF4169113.1 hypothetical protein CNMCM6936_009710 [Aspergillus lentulus]KAF4209517.1 hypothetical protein CNMCM8927_005917 [Aspergillus lentulus]